MNQDEIVDRLKRFGLEERAARAYYHLSRLGPSTASEISDATGVSRTQVYQVMDDLEELEVVERTLERPRRYVPRPPEEVLGETLADERRRLERLEELSQDLVQRWPRVDHDDEARRERFSVHQGRRQIAGLFDRMLEDAEDEVVILAQQRGIGRLDTMGVVDQLADEAADGLDLRVMTRVTEADRNRDALERLAEHGQVRHVALPGYAQFGVVDADQAALFVSLDPVASAGEGDETVLWLNARDFILGKKALADEIWTGGLALADRRQELATGEPAERAEVIRGRWMRYNRTKAMLRRADERARLALPAAELERLEEAGLATAMERAAARGVEVTLLAPARVDLAGVLVHETDLVDDMSIAVVDGQEALVGMGAEEAPGSMAREEDWNVWSSMPGFVDHFLRELDARAPGEQALADA